MVVGLVPRRIVPELRHFHWLLKMNNQSNWRHSKTVLRGTDPTVSATAPKVSCCVVKRRSQWDSVLPGIGGEHLASLHSPLPKPATRGEHSPLCGRRGSYRRALTPCTAGTLIFAVKTPDWPGLPCWSSPLNAAGRLPIVWWSNSPSAR